MAKPTKLPEWVTNPVVQYDSISGQPNILEPPSSKKARGWDYREKPPRNWLNWLLNTIYLWISWFSDRFGANGEHLYGNRERWILFSIPSNGGAGGLWTDGGAGGPGARYLFPNTSGATIFTWLPVDVGERIKQVDVYLFDNDSGGNIDCKLWKQSIAGGAAPGTPSQIGSTQSTSGSSTDIQQKQLTATETVLTNTQYGVEIQSTGVTTNTHRVYRIKVTTDRVA